MFKELLAEFRSDGLTTHRLAADLVELADRAGISPEAVLKHPELPRSISWEPPYDIRPEILDTAHLIERMYWTRVMIKVESINAQGQHKPKASPIVKMLYRILMASGTQLTLRGAFKARKQLSQVGIAQDDLSEGLMEKVRTYQQQLLG